MPLYAVTLLVTGPPDEIEAVAPAHREMLRELQAAGRIRAAGEFTDGDGYLVIFEAADRMEAEGLVASSPLVMDGLGTWMLREWIEL